MSSAVHRANAEPQRRARARSLVRDAQAAIAEILSAGDLALDATVGNGLDTLFLARAVGSSGRVWGFDCQPEALRRTEHRLSAAGVLQRVSLQCAGHENIGSLLPSAARGRLRAVMFNLGYLPGGDRTQITGPASTLQALRVTLPLLAAHGRISVVAYTGHPGGAQEAAAVALWASSLPSDDYRVRRVRSDHTRADAPLWILVTRLR